MRDHEQVTDNDSTDPDLRHVLARAVPDVRHPALKLSCFVADSHSADVSTEHLTATADAGDDPPPQLPESVRQEAELRRAALVVAGLELLEHCMDDLAELSFDERGMPDSEGAHDSVVYEVFPPRHRYAYDQHFFRNVLITVAKVCQDLADPNGGPPACPAEEIIFSHVIKRALDLCDDAGLGPPLVHPDDLLLEDTDFENLFDETMDGLEDDPAYQAMIGVEVPAVVDWFAPFNDDRVVHPYARTERHYTTELHDLRLRLHRLSADQHESLDWSTADDPAPITGVTATSEVVQLARQATDTNQPGVWVPDPNAPEASFGQLVQLTTLTDSGSGWLTWEPHVQADTVRTDGAVAFTPHRHFPVGNDEPWANVALGTRFLAIPLSTIVSYQPDPEPRRRWNGAFSALQ